MIHTIVMPNWHPTPLNRLMSFHWAKQGRLKKADYRVVAYYARGVPKAEVKRSVSVEITLAPRQRACDPDAYNKVLLDALVKCGLLKNDSHVWVELMATTFRRGTGRQTVVTLEDVE